MVTDSYLSPDPENSKAYDVIIVGGSVAGAATAIWLGQAGFHVLVLDQARFPRDKICGEGIQPAGVEILKTMRLLAPLSQSGGRFFHGITFSDHHGCSAPGMFPGHGSRPGLIIRRRALDHVLLSRAGAFSNVEIRQGFKVTHILTDGGSVRGVRGRSVRSEEAPVETLRAAVTVGADGIHSMFHRLAGVRVRRPRIQRFACRAYLDKIEGLDSGVEVMIHHHGEVYLAAHDDRTAMVALLLNRDSMNRFGGDLETAFWEVLRSVAPLRERIENSRMVSPVQVTGPLGSRVDGCVGNGYMLVGDSAGALDPITGEGMALALRSAQVASEVIAGGFHYSDCSAARLSAYGAAREKMVRPLARLTDGLLFLSRTEWLAHGAITGLRGFPGILARLMAVASGTHAADGSTSPASSHRMRHTRD